jgi:TRAP-type mannitol/chloroaromatic compound transport system permease large subunit
MEAFLIHNMAPIMFVSLVFFLMLGYPVAFALAANGIFFGLVGIKLGLLDASLFQALPERLWGVMSNDILLAVPVFHVHGAHPRAQRHGGGPARYRGTALRTAARAGSRSR